ncbi:YdcF family protein [Ensifer adhaerens]|uniref:YdcF family protein n=1 Tax=Ensifer adhaerens TaxID=106592 RepID=UPI001C4E1CFF|nr:YdcF family protein [Ensifer adhaerens]MBW0368986.1 YdcF family protein [Ensifer adhaerens]UCM22138.1 YdcF family protein [Ensifer adhaerens]
MKPSSIFAPLGSTVTASGTPRSVKAGSARRRLLGLLTATACLISAVPAGAFDQANAARIKQLVDTGMQYYWSGGDVKKAEAEVFKGITLHGKYDVVEEAFKEASTLAPERLDFQYAVAATQIIQKKLDDAQATFQSILGKDPTAFDAQSWLEAIARIRGDETGAALAHQALAGLDRERAEEYRKRFVRAEQIMAEKPNFDVPTVPGKVVIVALGYALADDGKAQQTLLDRLEVTLKVAEANPTALVMVSGGVPQNGVTEGDVMSKWLVDKGISRDRIMIEDKSKDTIGNVINAANLLVRHQADTVILVTSSSHMRRARTVMEDALKQRDLPSAVVPLNALDAPTQDEAAKVGADERLVIYRDLMRVSGVWAYPGLQQ